MWLCKDTNLKANHNLPGEVQIQGRSVCDSAKILIWKQITTKKVFYDKLPVVYVTLQRY